MLKNMFYFRFTKKIRILRILFKKNLTLNCCNLLPEQHRIKKLTVLRTLKWYNFIAI